MNWVSPASERPFKERGEEGGGFISRSAKSISLL